MHEISFLFFLQTHLILPHFSANKYIFSDHVQNKLLMSVNGIGLDFTQMVKIVQMVSDGARYLLCQSRAFLRCTKFKIASQRILAPCACNQASGQL